MRVLVCGGRDFGLTKEEKNFIYGELIERLKQYMSLSIMQGGAKGVDSVAKDWADADLTTCITFSADWKKHGRAAGPIRNQQMLDEGKPDLVIAFPGGRGTADMVRRAKKVGVKVIEVIYECKS